MGQEENEHVSNIESMRLSVIILLAFSAADDIITGGFSCIETMQRLNPTHAHAHMYAYTHTQRCVSVKVWRGGVDCCCHDCQTRRQLLQHMCEHFATKRDGMGQPTIPFLHHHGQCHNLDHCCKIPSLPRHRVGCGVSEDGHSSSTTWQAVSTMHCCMIHRVCIHNVHQNIFLVRPIRSSFGMMSDTHTRGEKK